MKSFSKLGWIGLGNMGSRIAKRLRNAGYPLIVYNRDRSKAQELLSQGAELAASPPELAAAADIIFSCLSDAAAIQSVYFGADGVLRNAKPGAHIVEMSTVAPETSLELFRIGADRNLIRRPFGPVAQCSVRHTCKNGRYRAGSSWKTCDSQAKRLHGSIPVTPDAEGFRSHSFEGGRSPRGNACNGRSR